MAEDLANYANQPNLMYVNVWNNSKIIEGLIKDYLSLKYKIGKKQPDL